MKDISVKDGPFLLKAVSISGWPLKMVMICQLRPAFFIRDESAIPGSPLKLLAKQVAILLVCWGL